MPNHVKTIVKFKNLKSKEDIEFILNMIASPMTTPTDPIEKADYRIDFDKIIPEPKTKEDCPEEFIRTASSHIQEQEGKPWFDWYKWHLTNWGTKWGAYDCYTIIGKSYVKFVFSTAWSLAFPVMERLHLLGYNIDIKFADENIGSNCGKLSYTKETGWTLEDEHKLKNPIRFAENIWNRY